MIIVHIIMKAKMLSQNYFCLLYFKHIKLYICNTKDLSEEHLKLGMKKFLVVKYFLTNE